jgi:hypothetical protein
MWLAVTAPPKDAQLRAISGLPDVVMLPEADLPPLRLPWGQYVLDEALHEGEASIGAVVITDDGEVHTVGASLPRSVNSAEQATVLGVWQLMRGLDLISHDAALDVTDGRTAVVGVDSKRAMEAINAVVGPLWLRPFLMDLHNLGVIGRLLLHQS